MKFEWDKQKNKANIEKHGLDFADAHKVFESPMLVRIDDREDYGEDRMPLANGARLPEMVP
ncbi:MAG: hypothetical protein COY47_04345 [Chloroflexi bacterium CG_4_10_14_0_8_um_filter_57_5]|nr:MAG: hypothetical protein COY47_04345 [Chloroflexi bacterium CG_4_10_14_0_8_um_filter_57_5]